jgi:hypothetical protein
MPPGAYLRRNKMGGTKIVHLAKTLTALAILPTLLAASPLPEDDPAIIICGSNSPQYSTPPTVVVVGSGSTQSAALQNLWTGNGMTDEFAAAQNVKCDSCGTADCEMTSDFSGSLSGIHYRAILDGEGNPIWWFAIAIFSGDYTIYCEDC